MSTNINDLAPPAWAVAGILPEQGVRLSEVVSALSYALDITEGQREGHAVRSCVIGMRNDSQDQFIHRCTPKTSGPNTNNRILAIHIRMS